jgi:hypothetical protein
MTIDTSLALKANAATKGISTWVPAARQIAMTSTERSRRHRLKHRPEGHRGKDRPTRRGGDRAQGEAEATDASCWCANDG